jgi:hypothetical protein
MSNKEEAYDDVQKAIAQCTTEDSVHSAVVIVVNNEKDTVKVFGLNIDETELPLLLIETAAEISERVSNLLKNRTLQ